MPGLSNAEGNPSVTNLCPCVAKNNRPSSRRACPEQCHSPLDGPASGRVLSAAPRSACETTKHLVHSPI